MNKIINMSIERTSHKLTLRKIKLDKLVSEKRKNIKNRNIEENNINEDNHSTMQSKIYLCIQTIEDFKDDDNINFCIYELYGLLQAYTPYKKIYYSPLVIKNIINKCFDQRICNEAIYLLDYISYDNSQIVIEVILKTNTATVLFNLLNILNNESHNNLISCFGYLLDDNTNNLNLLLIHEINYEIISKYIRNIIIKERYYSLSYYTRGNVLDFVYCFSKLLNSTQFNELFCSIDKSNLTNIIIDNIRDSSMEIKELSHEFELITSFKYLYEIFCSYTNENDYYLNTAFLVFSSIVKERSEEILSIFVNIIQYNSNNKIVNWVVLILHHLLFYLDSTYNTKINKNLYLILSNRLDYTISNYSENSKSLIFNISSLLLNSNENSNDIYSIVIDKILFNSTLLTKYNSVNSLLECLIKGFEGKYSLSIKQSILFSTLIIEFLIKIIIKNDKNYLVSSLTLLHSIILQKDILVMNSIIEYLIKSNLIDHLNNLLIVLDDNSTRYIIDIILNKLKI